MHIRYATMEDLDAIAQMEALCFPEAEAASKASFQERIAVFGDCFWLLEEDGQLIGMINGMATDLDTLCDEMFEDAHMHQPEGSWQMIFGVETLPEYRKQGYASLIMRRVIEDTKSRGKKGLVLTCKEGLVPFYAGFGFVNEGKSASVHGGAVWYDMRLTFAS